MTTASTLRYEDLAELATVEEARQYLRVSRNAMYEAVRAGEIPCVRIGRLIRIPREALQGAARGDDGKRV